ncbi:MAG: carboxypeptidase-like regulatory domain-containing protein [Chitinophagales bacterium]|nr:carboxypeptidase-like regulatory domain-containing protein [Chitinophagales bacterium]
MKKISTFFLLLFFIASCSKDPAGEILQSSVTLYGTVMHHWWRVGNIKVYIKGNAIEYPGSDPAAYDSFIKADPGGSFIFNSLPSGNYYLYAKGFDPTWGDTVNGALFLTLTVEPGHSIDVDTIVNVSE